MATADRDPRLREDRRGARRRAAVVGLAEEERDRRDGAAEGARRRAARAARHQATLANAEAVKGAGLVVVAVKPQDLEALLTEIGSALTSKQTVLSVAAAIPTAAIEAQLADGVPVVRAMPNTPATVHEGIAGICAGTHAEDEHLALAEECLSHLGAVVRLPERYMDAVTAVSGSGPAYFALLAEAMIEAGILLGLSREISTQLVVQTMLGTGVLLRDEKMHPGRAARSGHVARRHDDPRHSRARAGRRARRVPQRHPGGDGALARAREGRGLGKQLATRARRRCRGAPRAPAARRRCRRPECPRDTPRASRTSAGRNGLPRRRRRHRAGQAPPARPRRLPGKSSRPWIEAACTSASSSWSSTSSARDAA